MAIEDDGAIDREDFISDDALQAPLTLTKNIDVLLKKLDDMYGGVHRTVTTLKDQKVSLADVNKATATLSKNEADLIEVQKRLIKSIQDEGAATSKTDAEINSLSKDLAKLRTETERQSKEGQKLIKTIQDQAKEIKKLKDEAKAAAEANKKLGDSFKALDS